MKKTGSFSKFVWLFLLSGFAGAFILMSGLAEERLYKIGDKGPGGGIVFFDKGQKSDGWRYLEAAPADAGYSGWGCRKDAISEAYETDPGKGKYNTDLIVSECKEAKTAAKLAASYRGGDKKDWYLPARDELELLYKNLHKAGLGNFTGVFYWSSTQKTVREAFGMDFKFGPPGYSTDKADERRVRPVRAFLL